MVLFPSYSQRTAKPNATCYMNSKKPHNVTLQGLIFITIGQVRSTYLFGAGVVRRYGLTSV